MATVTVTQQIDAPRERVFEVFSDLENAAERIPDIIKIEVLTEGPFGEGTRWRETRMMFKKEATEEMWITAYDPPSGYDVAGHSCGCDWLSTIRFTDAAGGGTTVEMAMTSKAKTVMAKVMSPLGWLMKGMMKKCIEKDLEAFKEHCERESAVAV